MEHVLALSAGDDPQAWAALGFAVSEGSVRIGRARLRADGSGGGLRSMAVEEASGAGPAHPNGALELDHVVLVTPSLDAGVASVVELGGEERRRRDDLHSPMAFVRLAGVIVEVVQRGDEQRLWGVVATVPDLGALGDAVGEIRDAVQPGRQIAPARRRPGLETAVAFMTPRVRAR
jgi:hypothetical protein